MKPTSRFMPLLPVLLATVASPAMSGGPPALEHNPFTRPSTDVTATAPIPAQGVAAAQTLDVRATMVGTRGRLANVAGKTLSPGDQIFGFTLLEVFEDRAVFSRDGTRRTVFVKAATETDDE